MNYFINFDLYKKLLRSCLIQMIGNFRSTYHLDDWTTHTWSQVPPDLDMFTMFGGDMGEFVKNLNII